MNIQKKKNCVCGGGGGGVGVGGCEGGCEWKIE